MPEATLDDLAGHHLRGRVCRRPRPGQRRRGHPRAPTPPGPTRVVCCDGTVDPFNPKTVRASAGSVLHSRSSMAGDAGDVLDALAARGLRRLAAVSTGWTPYTEVDLTSPFALVLGNEASGLPAALEERLDARVTIPMGGGAESLNVSTAAAVLCFEAARRRSNLHAMEEAR